jgi:hypothetical protein
MQSCQDVMALLSTTGSVKSNAISNLPIAQMRWKHTREEYHVGHNTVSIISFREMSLVCRGTGSKNPRVWKWKKYLLLILKGVGTTKASAKDYFLLHEKKSPNSWSIVRMIANALWYVPDEDLNVPLVKEVIKQRSTRYHNKLEGHANVLIQPLLQPHNERRLKRNWPADLREG